MMNKQKGLSFFSSLMGGGMENFSIILMWLSPYINAMIILQVLWVIIPKLGDLQKNENLGKKDYNLY